MKYNGLLTILFLLTLSSSTNLSFASSSRYCKSSDLKGTWELAEYLGNSAEDFNNLDSWVFKTHSDGKGTIICSGKCSYVWGKPLSFNLDKIDITGSDQFLMLLDITYTKDSKSHKCILHTEIIDGSPTNALILMNFESNTYVFLR